MIRRLWRLTTTVIISGLCLVHVVAAQPVESPDGFVPVAPGDLQQEVLPAAPLVFSAYSFVWVAVAVYLFTLWRRMQKAEADLRDLSSKLR